LDVQELHNDVTKELLTKEFSKFGQLKDVKHYPKTSSAMIAFENGADAKEAKRKLNHTMLLKKEISIHFSNKDVLC